MTGIRDPLGRDDTGRCDKNSSAIRRTATTDTIGAAYRVYQRPKHPRQRCFEALRALQCTSKPLGTFDSIL